MGMGEGGRGRVMVWGGGEGWQHCFMLHNGQCMGNNVKLEGPIAIGIQCPTGTDTSPMLVCNQAFQMNLQDLVVHNTPNTMETFTDRTSLSTLCTLVTW